MKIGLTYTGSEQKHINYSNWIKGADTIEVITLSAELNNLKSVKNVGKFPGEQLSSFS